MGDAKKPGRHGKPRCGDFGGVSKQTGKPCGRGAGAGTEHKGAGKCSTHFGNTEAENRKAQEILAGEACSRLGIPLDGVTPEQALLAELWECAGNVAFYRHEIQQLEARPEPDRLVTDAEGRHWERGEPGIYGRTYHQSGIPTGEAKPHVLVVLYEGERDRLRKVCSELIRTGIEERRVRLAEADAAWIFAAIATTFSLMGLEERLDEFRDRFADALGPGPPTLSATSNS